MQSSVYNVCVVILNIIGAIFGISYVDSLVYVCEYAQPIVTALLVIVPIFLASKS